MFKNEQVCNVEKEGHHNQRVERTNVIATQLATQIANV